jgi:eukaryotic-like serine/threonine-protein kinase
MIGQTISHYKILEKLGEGGMGVVYKAQDTRLDRVVALKFLPASITASREDAARLEQEAKAISALNHPGIATIHDIDEADGKRFIVLELITGGTLKQMLKKLAAESTQLSIAEAIDSSIQIADGLAHAHRNQIIHRDIKSDNIMLTGEGKIKITDFGLAKLRNSLELTRSGSTVGTVAYMAPEVIQGAEADGRSDIFSFGTVMYEMLTGRLPFRGEHEAAMMYSITNEDPSPVSSMRTDVPAPLEQLITKSLHKDPAQRYQSAADIMNDLRTLQQETTGTVKTVIVRRHTKLPWIIAAAVLLLAAIGFYFFAPASRTTAANRKTIAVLPFTNLSQQKDEEYLSDGMTEDILTHLVKIADLKVISRTTMMQYKGAKKSLREIGKELNAGVILEGSVRRADDQIRVVAQLIDATNDEHLWAETYDREFKQVFSIQSEIAQKIATSLQATLSPEVKEMLTAPTTVNTEAYTAYLQGRYFLDRKSNVDIERAIDYFERALKIDPNYALAWVGLSLAHGTQADYSYVTVQEGYGKARTEGERALQLNPNIADAHTNMGWIHKNYDLDWAAADRSFRRAVELEPRNAAAVRGASSLAYTFGRFDEAIALGKRAIELDPLLPAGYYNLGSYEYFAGHLREAEAAYKKALELWPQYPVAHMWLGRVYLAQAKPESALATIQLEPDRMWRLQGLALAHHALENAAESNRALAELMSEFSLPSGFQIAEVFAFRGELDKAFEWLDRAYEQRDGGFSMMKGNPLMRNLVNDPRYASFMKKLQLPI